MGDAEGRGGGGREDALLSEVTLIQWLPSLISVHVAL